MLGFLRPKWLRAVYEMEYKSEANRATAYRVSVGH